jgi:hypothetical protein
MASITLIYNFGETQNDQHNVYLLGVNSDLDLWHDICRKLLQGWIVIIGLHLGRDLVVAKPAGP